MHATLFTDTMPEEFDEDELYCHETLSPGTFADHDDSVTRCSLCGWEVIACQCKANGDPQASTSSAASTSSSSPAPNVSPTEPVADICTTPGCTLGRRGEEEPGGAGLLLLQAGAHRPHRRGHGGVQQLALSVSSSTNATSRSIHPRWTLCGDSVV